MKFKLITAALVFLIVINISIAAGEAGFTKEQQNAFSDQGFNPCTDGNTHCFSKKIGPDTYTAIITDAGPLAGKIQYTQTIEGAPASDPQIYDNFNQDFLTKPEDMFFAVPMPVNVEADIASGAPVAAPAAPVVAPALAAAAPVPEGVTSQTIVTSDFGTRYAIDANTGKKYVEIKGKWEEWNADTMGNIPADINEKLLVAKESVKPSAANLPEETAAPVDEFAATGDEIPPAEEGPQAEAEAILRSGLLFSDEDSRYNIYRIGDKIYAVDTDKNELSMITQSGGSMAYTPVQEDNIPDNLQSMYSFTYGKELKPARSTNEIPVSRVPGNLENGELTVSFVMPSGKKADVSAFELIDSGLLPETIVVDGIELHRDPTAPQQFTGTETDTAHGTSTTLTVTPQVSILEEKSGGVPVKTTTVKTNDDGSKEIAEENLEKGTRTTTNLDENGKKTGKTTEGPNGISSTVKDADGTRSTECNSKGCIQRVWDKEGNELPSMYCNGDPTECKTKLDNEKDPKNMEEEAGLGKCKECMGGANTCCDADSGFVPGSMAGQGFGAAVGKALYGATRYSALGDRISSWLPKAGWMEWWQNNVAENIAKIFNTDTWVSQICRIRNLKGNEEGTSVVYSVNAAGEAEAVISVQGLRIPIEMTSNETVTEYIYNMEFYVKNNNKDEVLMFMPKIRVTGGAEESLFNKSILVGGNRSTANFRGDRMIVMKLKKKYDQLCLDWTVKPSKIFLEMGSVDDLLCVDFIQPDETGPVSTIEPENFPWEDEGDVLTQTAAATGTTVDSITASQTQDLRNPEGD